jgi:hypothetical protein
MANLLGTWRPKKGDKCDYKPKVLKDASYFMMGTVEDIVKAEGAK